MTYWDEVASTYDELYSGWWSLRENDIVRGNLRFLGGLERPQVLDLGSGTGLGYHLCRSVNPDLRYVGVDSSPQMLRCSPVQQMNIQADFHDLSFRADNTADVVVMLFSTLSFVSDVPRFLTEVRRILRPGGHLYVSALSRYALSRATSAHTPSGRYRTRGDNHRRSVPATRYTTSELRRVLAATRFHNVRVSGVNSFSGLLELRPAWTLGRLVSRTAVATSHTLEVVARCS